MGGGIVKVINRKARFDYEVGERVEAGIELRGPEVKSAKLGQVDLGGSHIKIQNAKFKSQKEAWVYNLKIFPYKYADNTNYDPMRPRKLLLHQREIVALTSKMKQSRRSLVPTAMYTKSDLVKVEIALARGERKYEKREEIKRKEWKEKGM